MAYADGKEVNTDFRKVGRETESMKVRWREKFEWGVGGWTKKPSGVVSQ
jgi:hypothetical protein